MNHSIFIIINSSWQKVHGWISRVPQFDLVIILWQSIPHTQHLDISTEKSLQSKFYTLVFSKMLSLPTEFRAVKQQNGNYQRNIVQGIFILQGKQSQDCHTLRCFLLLVSIVYTALLGTLHVPAFQKSFAFSSVSLLTVHMFISLLVSCLLE